MTHKKKAVYNINSNMMSTKSQRNRKSTKLPLVGNPNGLKPSLSSRSEHLGLKTPRVNVVSSLSQNEAISILHQYNNISKTEDLNASVGLPLLTNPSRTGWVRHEPVRARLTSKSLAKVERSNQFFTEGLSSISKCKDLPLAVRRKDFIAANMPETVTLARVKSRVAIGMSRKLPRQYKNKESRKTKIYERFKSSNEMANDILAPLIVSQAGHANEQNALPKESKIALMLKGLENKYGTKVVQQAMPQSPETSFYDDYTSQSTTVVSTPAPSPRGTPPQRNKATLSVISFGDALMKIPEHSRRQQYKVRSPDVQYNELERYKQNKTNKPVIAEIKLHAITEHDNNENGFVGTLRSYLDRKLQRKTEHVNKKKHIIIPVRDIYEDSERSHEGTSDKKSHRTGSFQVQGVVGVGARVVPWSADTASTTASVLNPPPSVEVGLYDLGSPATPNPQVILDDEYLHTKGQALSVDNYLSDALSVCSSYLTVPSVDCVQEGRPQLVPTPLAESQTDAVPILIGEKTGTNEIILKVINKTLDEQESGYEFSPEQSMTGVDKDLSDKSYTLKKSEHSLSTTQKSLQTTREVKGTDEDLLSLQVSEHLVRYKDEESVMSTGVEDASDSGGMFVGKICKEPSGVPQNASVQTTSITFMSPIVVQTNAKRQ